MTIPTSGTAIVPEVFQFPALKLRSFSPEHSCFPKSRAHFSQISLFDPKFLVNILKSCKNYDFWIDFTETLAYNRLASA